MEKFIIYIDNVFEDIQEVELFDSYEEAQEEFEAIKEELQEEGVQFDSGENCITTEDTMYVCVSVEDAVDPTNKIIWTTSQSVYGPNASPFFEWSNSFSNHNDAVALLQERLAMYEIQAEGDPSINIEKSDSGRSAYIYKNGELVVGLYCDVTAVGLIGDTGTVILNNM